LDPSKYAIEVIVAFFKKKTPDDDPRIETRVGVTIYNKNYKKVVLHVH
jgi:ribosomal protein L31E